MRRSAALALLLGSLLAADGALAQDVHCDDAASQAALDACSADEYAAADKLLNAAYRNAMKRMEEADRGAAEMGPEYVGAVEALKKAQRGWIAYRDGQCDAAGYEMLGGSAAPLIVNGCLTDLTRARTKELDALLNGSDG